MDYKYFLIVASLIITSSLISADVLVSVLPLEPGMSIVLLIPIVLIESFIAYFIVKKYHKVEIRVMPVLGIILLSNILTTLVGWIFVFNGISPLANHYGLVLRDLPLLIGVFLLTVVLELPGIYLLIRKKCESVVSISIITSLIVNFVSYLLLILFVVFTSSGQRPPF